MYLPIAQHDEPFFVRGLESVAVNVARVPVRRRCLPRAWLRAYARVNPQLTAHLPSTRGPSGRFTGPGARMATLARLLRQPLRCCFAALGLYGRDRIRRLKPSTEIRHSHGPRAGPGSVVALVMSRVTMLVGVGVVVAPASACGRRSSWLRCLYGLEARDPATLTGAGRTFWRGSLLQFPAGLPAWRASRIDPARFSGIREMPNCTFQVLTSYPALSIVVLRTSVSLAATFDGLRLEVRVRQHVDRESDESKTHRTADKVFKFFFKF